MPQRTVRVAARAGLHARPAALFTRAASQSGYAITVSNGVRSADAASILAVLSLGVGQGDEVTLSSEDPEAESALDALQHLLRTTE